MNAAPSSTPTPPRASAIYEGTLRHRRRSPSVHAFTLPLYMTYLDLAELDRVFAGRWFWSTRRPSLSWFRRADYLGDPATPLDTAVRDRIQASSGTRPTGPIRVLTNLRTWGYCFNPVTFYYCFNANDTAVETIVAEITNTPWKERHAYVLAVPPTGLTPQHAFEFSKAFHVSPFMPMEQLYRWQFSPPGQTLLVHMNNLSREATAEPAKVFDATLSLHRTEFSTASLARILFQYPALTLAVVFSIHWHAFRLWLKRVPFHTHPSKRTPQPARPNQ